MPNWVNPCSKYCLVGDAAHAMTPYFAQGAAIGIEDAAILGGLLAKQPQQEALGNNLRLDEQVRIEHAQKVARESIGSRPLVHADARWPQEKGAG
jgi:salicylate hydroxylase